MHISLYSIHTTFTLTILSVEYYLVEEGIGHELTKDVVGNGGLVGIATFV